MISISSIKTYMYCPLKLYLEQNFDEKIDRDILLHKTMKELRMDLQDLFQRNLRRLKKEMDIDEIEENLSKNIEEYITNSIAILENSENEYSINKNGNKNEYNNKYNNEYNNEYNTEHNNEYKDIINNENKDKNNNDVDNENQSKYPNYLKNEFNRSANRNDLKTIDLIEHLEEEIEEHDAIEEIKTEIQAEAYFNMKILALKAQKAMIMNEKDGNQISELFFPTSMYSYLMRDTQLEIVGTSDKIEIIDGKYYPISLKSSTPPFKGVWDGDSIELVAAALLIEQEFDTEVFVGFVDYLKIGDRRPVVMDANLRKGLFRVLKEINDILNEKIVPEINENVGKCLNCDYSNICHQKEKEKP